MPGHDQVSAEVLKPIADYISQPFTFIINKSIENGVFPTVLKKTIIVPLFKGGDKLKLSNYRPISVISNLAKAF